ncbi:MAG: hypothetical protein MUW56_03245 [Chryseobacterium sp.]|uniref:hypothetical protein n=1 Tax=Chryseobacterium sp. TaxID=1871047 RepID=UPI0025BC5A5F|nr:hypothetical protein [Chryseobacterium sp.]MCJ7932663.1 hypothetical protein [Chryseobacterium sp.]
MEFLPDDNETPILIGQAGHATGDIFSVATTLVGDERIHVVISEYEGDKRTTAIKDFYRQSKIAEDRILGLKTEKTEENVAGKLKNDGIMLYKEKIKQLGGDETKIQYVSVQGATEWVAKNYSVALQEKLKNAWEVNGSKDPQIKEWLNSKGIKDEVNNVLVLWSRFSGKNGEIHLEHDSSYTGIKQILEKVAEKYDAVIITGDKRYNTGNKEDNARKEKKYDDIAKVINSQFDTPRVFNLTEFWKDITDPLLLAWLRENDRIGQFKLYDYLSRTCKNVQHLGFRSGNLEAMALLGNWVRYMEEPVSKGGERMTMWDENSEVKVKEGGIKPQYKRLLVQKVSTNSGKWLKDNIAAVQTEIDLIHTEREKDQKTKQMISAPLKIITNKIKKGVSSKLNSVEMDEHQKAEYERVLAGIHEREEVFKRDISKLEMKKDQYIRPDEDIRRLIKEGKAKEGKGFTPEDLNEITKILFSRLSESQD